MANPLSMRALAQALIQDRGVMPGTRHAPGSDEEDIAYGYPGQGDAYDNPQNPNYYLNDLEPQGNAGNPSAMSWHQPAGMEGVFQPDTYPAIDMLQQGPTRPGPFAPMGAGMDVDQEDYFDTDMGAQELYGMDMEGSPIPGQQQYDYPETDAEIEATRQRKQAILNRQGSR